ncbi:hypothetical protein L208DRAFT_1399414, partial [Tricholoma matsutake]
MFEPTSTNWLNLENLCIIYVAWHCQCINISVSHHYYYHHHHHHSLTAATQQQQPEPTPPPPLPRTPMAIVRGL